MEVRTTSAAETEGVGRRVGAALRRGDLLLLEGELGAGKTTLTQGIAQGAQVVGYVHSPTFVLAHRYDGRLPLFHLDLYRTDGGLEVHDLGVEEMLEAGAVVVEWADRAPDIFPTERLELRLRFGSAPEERHIAAEARGERAAALARCLEGAS